MSLTWSVIKSKVTIFVKINVSKWASVQHYYFSNYCRFKPSYNFSTICIENKTLKYTTTAFLLEIGQQLGLLGLVWV